MEVSSKRPVIRCVSGLTKSERRKFKENERKRIAELKEFPSVSEASSSMKDVRYIYHANVLNVYLNNAIIIL